MNRLRTMLALVLCVFVAVLSIAYVTVGMKDKPEKSAQTTSATTAAVNQQGGYYQPAVEESSLSGQEESSAAAQSEATTPTTQSPQTEQTTVAATEPKTLAGDYEFAYAGFNPSVATVDSERWNLLLVNQSYILPEDFSVQTSEIKGSSQRLDSRVVPHYNDMIAAAKADGIDLIPVSGYRTVERQRANFNRKIDYYSSLGYSKAEATRLAAKIVLMPGTSEHNAGLAMDFGTNGNTSLDENFANTKAFKWLSENAADYGFILRYEEDTTDITKISYEPWHWRYVGTEVAKDINAKGVTLEEYLGMA